MSATGEEMGRTERYSMRKVLSIDEIKAECDRLGANCVVSTNAPLVTALNARSESPLFGYAFTPIQIADAE